MKIESIEALEGLYGAAHPASLDKVMDRIVGAHAAWIAASNFVVLTTVGPEGTDASPRGDIGSVATLLDERHLAIPDWQGNNRLDSLRNIVRDGRCSLMFMVAGATVVVRVNGRAELRTDADLIGRFEVKGKHPACVIVVEVAEIYMQCPKALLRSGLWGDTKAPDDLPTPGQLIAEGSSGRHGGPAYDDTYPERAKERMW